jgi:hypothetical protein
MLQLVVLEFNADFGKNQAIPSVGKHIASSPPLHVEDVSVCRKLATSLTSTTVV